MYVFRIPMLSFLVHRSGYFTDTNEYIFSILLLLVCSEWDEDDLVSGTDMGVPQDISESDEGEATRAIIIEAREYMAGVFLDESVKKLCRNEHPGCSFWATLGECEGRWFFHDRIIRCFFPIRQLIVLISFLGG